VRECLCVSVCVYLSTVPIHCLGRFLFAISTEELYITYTSAFSTGLTVPFRCTVIVFVGIEVGVLCSHLRDCGRVHTYNVGAEPHPRPGYSLEVP